MPVHDDRRFFEMLTLEGAQAGLNWTTILRRREGYRRAFGNFDPGHVAGFGDTERSALLLDSEIIRNRAKVDSTISNAKTFLTVQEKWGSFDAFIWRFVDGKPLRNHWNEPNEVPITTPTAHKLSKELLALGFRFVGPTICYSLMQATGLVNDHLVSCFRHGQV